MKLPKKVKSGAITYRVEVVDDWMGGNGDDGETCWRKPRGNVIYIHDQLTDDAKGITFFHEALHTMNGTMNHEFLDSLAQQLYAFLKENDLLK